MEIQEIVSLVVVITAIVTGFGYYSYISIWLLRNVDLESKPYSKALFLSTFIPLALGLMHLLIFESLARKLWDILLAMILIFSLFFRVGAYYPYWLGKKKQLKYQRGKKV